MADISPAQDRVENHCAFTDLLGRAEPSIESKILNAVPIVAMAVNGTGEVVFASPSIEQLLGHKVEEVLGNGWWNVSALDGRFRAEAKAKYAAYARGEIVLEQNTGEGEYRHRDGSSRWVLWSFAKGPENLLVAVGQDITPRNLERHELRERTAQLNALFESSPLGIVISDARDLVTACNLANLNTVGYKQTRTTFRDLFYQNVGSSGSGNPIQIGAGAAVGSVSTIFSGSNIESSGVPTDVAISGDGFFVVEKDGANRYTRAGNFTISPTGVLSTENGEQVLGYPALNGVVDPSQGLLPLQMGKGQISPPHATTSVQMRTNLDASEPVGFTFNSPMTVYDSLGDSHPLSFQFTKTGANQWSYNVSLPAADTGAATDTSLATGTLTFDGNGALSLPTGNVTGITTPALVNGASPVSFTWNLFDKGAGTITQLSSSSSTASKHQDGFSSGTLEDFAIGSDGVIQGSFSNGKTMAIGQLVLANFPNTQGLLRTGSNNFESTLASGLPVVGTPGNGGRGTIAGGALELSNVDIASEFAKMIVAQRGFQANARAVTTFDEITQETINLKR